MNSAARFWAKVVKTEGCWLWMGARLKGYGQVRVNKKLWYAHRWSYVQAHGAIPDGLVLDHLCRTPACVRPDHLEPVTSGENVRRGWSATGCTRGHAFTDDNVYIRPDAPWRQCLTCIRLRRTWVAERRRAERVPLPEKAAA